MAGDRVDIPVSNVGMAQARPSGCLSITDDDWAASLTVSRPRHQSGTAWHAGRGADAIVMSCSVNARLPDPAVLNYSAA